MGATPITKAEFTYFQISYGTFIQTSLPDKSKVTSETKGATRFESKKGTVTWALAFKDLTGYLESIDYVENKDYGNKVVLSIRDGIDVFKVTIAEDSRFWFAIAEKLPNADLTKQIYFKPFDFIDKTSGKRKIGVTMRYVGEKGDLIQPFYIEFDKDKKMIRKHGYPSGEGVNWKDVDDMKIYNIKVKKFFLSELENRLKPMLKKQVEYPKPIDEVKATESIEDFAVADDDDLPF